MLKKKKIHISMSGIYSLSIGSAVHYQKHKATKDSLQDDGLIWII